MVLLCGEQCLFKLIFTLSELWYVITSTLNSICSEDINWITVVKYVFVLFHFHLVCSDTTGPYANIKPSLQIHRLSQKKDIISNCCLNDELTICQKHSLPSMSVWFCRKLHEYRANISRYITSTLLNNTVVLY